MMGGHALPKLPQGQSAGFQGRFSLDTEEGSLKVSTRQMTIAGIQMGAERVPELPRIPLFDNVRAGTWKGWLGFTRSADTAAEWSGEIELQNALMDVPGVAAP